MSIWRLGQITKDDLEQFSKQQKLSYYWLHSDTNYKNEKDLKKFRGWTCIDPWVNEVQKDDIVFLVSKYNYAGVAQVLDGYKFKKYDFQLKEHVLPGVPVKFLHLLNEPIEHHFNISHTNPRTFCKINQFGFDLNTILKFIKSEFPKSFESILKVANTFQENRNKISRICWNTNGWVKPSGRYGKSKTPSHEKQFGFGHEEWLLDVGKVYNGYHYGFLEPVRKFQTKYEGKTFNFLLYTVDSNSQKQYFIGWLRNVEVINQNEAANVLAYYKRMGWLEIMKQELEEIGLEGNRIVNKYLDEIDILNIKFKPSEISGIFEKFIPISTNNKLVKYARYILRNVEDYLSPEELEEIHREYDFNTGNMGEKNLVSKSKRKYESKEVEATLKHNVLSDKFLEYLQNQFGMNYVKRECDANGGGSVDVVLRTKKGDVFYEIKTYNHLKTSLRVALGQLLEYSTFPDKDDAIKICLVSDLPPKEDFIKYIKHLNSLINIPLTYIQFDSDSQKILKEI